MEYHLLGYRGQSVEQVAKTLDVHRSNVYRWINRYHATKNIEREHNPLSGQRRCRPVQYLSPPLPWSVC
ncbi:hypothetical protein WCLP8_3000001 [uncultured Gammaproteobacteria bacterium]